MVCGCGGLTDLRHLGAHPLDGEEESIPIDTGAPFAAFNVAHARNTASKSVPLLRVTFPDVPVVPLLFGDVDHVVGRKLVDYSDG